MPATSPCHSERQRRIRNPDIGGNNVQQLEGWMLVLETPRLRLRQMTWDDADNLLGIFADPMAMRFYPSTKDRGETEAWIARHLRGYAEDGIGLWIAELADTGQFVGQCGLVAQEVAGQREIEIGYLF